LSCPSLERELGCRYYPLSRTLDKGLAKASPLPFLGRLGYATASKMERRIKVFATSTL